MRPEMSLQQHCVQCKEHRPLRDWAWEENTPLTPETVSAGSHKRVWWRCPQGHQWQAQVRVRAAGSECPYCSGRLLWVGANDLATLRPQLAAEWDREKNAPLRPEQVSPGSHRLVWWRCARGHSWRARILSRTDGSGCPICTGKAVLAGENDLATRYPRLAEEWDREKNAPLLPASVTPGSNKRVWWRCEKGHSWQAVIAARVSGSQGCPVCAGRQVLAGFNDLATLRPRLAEEWDQELNGDLTPQQVGVGSHKKVWWRCSLGHVWKAMVFSRAGKGQCGCPVCAGKVKMKE